MVCLGSRRLNIIFTVVGFVVLQGWIGEGGRFVSLALE